MPKWLKVLLLVGAALLVLCIAGAGAFAAWLNANKDELKAQGDQVKQEGQAFGRSADANACVAEGLRRLDAERGIVKQALNNIFVEECLKVAQRDDSFCRNVPPRSELVQTATWARDQCALRAHENDQDCGRMMQVVQRACTE